MSGALARSVFRRGHLCHGGAIAFADALDTSRLLLNAAVWGELSAANERALQGTLGVLYRGALRLPHRNPAAPRAAEAEVMVAAERLGAQDRIRVARLRYVGRALSDGPLGAAGAPRRARRARLRLAAAPGPGL